MWSSGETQPLGSNQRPSSALSGPSPSISCNCFRETHTHTISLTDPLSYALLQTVWQHTHTHVWTLHPISGHISNVSLRPHRQISWCCNGRRCRNNGSIWNCCMDEIMYMCHALNSHWTRYHSDSMTCRSHDITHWEVKLNSWVKVTCWLVKKTMHMTADSLKIYEWFFPLSHFNFCFCFFLSSVVFFIFIWFIYFILFSNEKVCSFKRALKSSLKMK